MNQHLFDFRLYLRDMSITQAQQSAIPADCLLTITGLHLLQNMTENAVLHEDIHLNVRLSVDQKKRGEIALSWRKDEEKINYTQ